ncbi:MAG: ABC transporter ATP-binding protein [Polyangia bacterium]|jgi:putative ABC transport system ATP-binding protein
MNAIEARDLSKWFGEGETRTNAVQNVAFDAHFQEMLFIVGPSGSGKTTLLSMLSGILRPNQGTVKIKDQDIWSLSADKLADMRLHTVGFVFQDFHLFPKLTTVENVAVPLILKRRKWDEAIKEALQSLEKVGIAQRAHLSPQKLSGGEQQRVAIARAIVSQPDILVFDEPTASLDGDTGRKIVEFVKRDILNAQRCIIIVTHDDRISEFADRMIKMEDGKVMEIEKGQSHA